MKVSFLMTYYNQREYVEQSLESILAIEKPCDWEIIVGDDGSTDGTVDVVREYIKKYPDNIHLYIMPREEGKKYDSVKRASANRLNILEHSTGNIFCTLDGDDYYCDTTFIKEAISVFRNHKDIAIVAFGYRYVTDGIFGEPITLPSHLNNKYVDKKRYLERHYLPAGGCVHRKCFDNERIKLINELGFFDDNNITINTLNYGEMYAINKAIYAYRQTGQSVYNSMNELEQAVLNVQGMDVDLRLVDYNFKNAIFERYSTSFIMMYIWKKELRAILGEEKCKMYEDGCISFRTSLCYKLLNYSVISNEEKSNLKRIYNNQVGRQLKFALTQKIIYCLRGFWLSLHLKE